MGYTTDNVNTMLMVGITERGVYYTCFNDLLSMARNTTFKKICFMSITAKPKIVGDCSMLISKDILTRYTNTINRKKYIYTKYYSSYQRCE